MVYGVTGSGKTTLAREISTRTGLPFTEIDALTWEPSWKAVDPNEQRRRIGAVCDREEWVIDHAYAIWVDIVEARAQLVVALDYPRWLSLSRLTLRCAKRLFDQKPMCNGNRESLGHLVSRESIVVWHFRSFSRKRTRMRQWDTDNPFESYVRLCSPRQTRRWLNEFVRHINVTNE